MQTTFQLVTWYGLDVTDHLVLCGIADHGYRVVRYYKNSALSLFVHGISRLRYLRRFIWKHWTTISQAGEILPLYLCRGRIQTELGVADVEKGWIPIKETGVCTTPRTGYLESVSGVSLGGSG